MSIVYRGGPDLASLHVNPPDSSKTWRQPYQPGRGTKLSVALRRRYRLLSVSLSSRKICLKHDLADDRGGYCQHS